MSLVKQVTNSIGFVPAETLPVKKSLGLERGIKAELAESSRVSLLGAKHLENSVLMLHMAQEGLNEISSKLGHMKNLAQNAATQPHLKTQDYLTMNDNMQSMVDDVVKMTKDSSYAGIPMYAHNKPGDGMIVIDAGEVQIRQKLPNLLDSAAGEAVLSSDGRINLENLKTAVQIKDANTGAKADQTLDMLINSLQPVNKFYTASMRSLGGMSNLLKYQARVLDSAIRAHEAISNTNMEDIVYSMAHNSMQGGSVYSSLV